MLNKVLKYQLNLTHWFKKTDDLLERNSIKQASCLIVILLSFILIYILNRLQPIFGDDWRYSMMDDGHTRISSISDIYISLYNHYFEWGGRIVVHIIDEVLLMLNSQTSDLINSLAFVFFTLIIYKIANIGNTIRPSLLLGINMLIFFFAPSFGSTILWITGSSNYLWGTLIVLSFLFYYARHTYLEDSNDTYVKQIAFFFFGMVAGSTNENVTIALISMLIGFTLFYKIEYGKIPIWAITGFVGVIIGAVFMIAAPGNYVRMELANSNAVRQSFIKIYTKQFLTAIAGYYYYVLVPTFIYILTLWLYSACNNQKKVRTVIFLSLLFMVGAIVSVLAMTASPIFPGRATFGSISFVFVATCILFANIDFKNLLIKGLVYTSLTFVLLVFATDYYRGYRTLKEVDTHLEERKKIIDEGKRQGISDFIFEDRITPDSRFLHYFELSHDPDDWHNLMYSGYNNINSIIIK